MPDYTVKVLPELDSRKFQKEMKKLTRDRTLKIKVDTSGLEQAARLAEKLNKTPIVGKIADTGPLKIPSDADIARIRQTQKAYEDLYTSARKAAQSSPTQITAPNILPKGSTDTSSVKEMIQALNELQKASETAQKTTNTSSPSGALKSILDGGMSALDTVLKADSMYRNASDLSDRIKEKFSKNLDQPKSRLHPLL